MHSWPSAPPWWYLSTSLSTKVSRARTKVVLVKVVSWIINYFPEWHSIYIHIPLISLHTCRSVYKTNWLFRKPPLLEPPLSCAKYHSKLKHNLNLKGWNSQAHGGFPGKFESGNVSRDNASREIGRISFKTSLHGPHESQSAARHSDSSWIVKYIVLYIVYYILAEYSTYIYI